MSQRLAPDTLALLRAFDFVETDDDRWIREEPHGAGLIEVVYDTAQAVEHAQRLAAAVMARQAPASNQEQRQGG